MKKQLITLFFILQMLPGWSNSHATSITDSLLTVLSTTQIYADLVNSKKRETANKISLK